MVKSRAFLILVIALLLCDTALAEKGNRILIILDGSSSMLEQWDKDHSRFNTASSIVLRLMDSIYQFNDEVEFGLRVYGHQHAAQDNDCYDSKLEVMFSKDNKTQMQLRLESLKPAGISPIAYSLKQAAEQDLISANQYNYSIILITDGGESCNANICDVVQQLLTEKIAFKPYVISLVNYKPLLNQYACFGDYLPAFDQAAIAVTIDEIMNDYKKHFLPSTKLKKKKTADIATVISTYNRSVSAMPKLRPVLSKPIPNSVPLHNVQRVQFIEKAKGIGYLKLTNIDLKIVKLFYQNPNGFIEVSSFLNTYNNHRIELKAGVYKLDYQQNEKIFVIKERLITEIKY